jgi:hypothetical protein
VPGGEISITSARTIFLGGGGPTIAIEDGEDLVAPGQRVDTPVPADRREAAPRLRSLEMAVRACAARMAPRHWSAGEGRAAARVETGSLDRPRDATRSEHAFASGRRSVM